MVSRIEPEKPDEEIDFHEPLDVIDVRELRSLKPIYEVQLAGIPDAPLHGKEFSISIGQVLGRALMESTLSGFSLVDVALVRADCSNATWVDARIVRTRFDGCKLTGFDARGGELRDVVFNECKMSDTFMVESKLTRVRFDGCKISGLDLCDSKVNSVAIRGCDARNLRLMGAKIELLDLRGSMIEGIAIDPGSVGGVIIDPMQSCAIASALGARVMDLHE